MTTKTFDSTISQIPQDDSSVEYVAPEKNLITTIQTNELIFGQKHNDIDCALCPTAKRACDRAWVTAKQVENWSKMSTTTLWRWLEKLEKARRIASFSDMKKTPILDSAGVPHETTLYNLNVLNQLAMVCRVCRDRDMAVINGKEYPAKSAEYSESRVFSSHR